MILLGINGEEMRMKRQNVRKNGFILQLMSQYVRLLILLCTDCGEIFSRFLLLRVASFDLYFAKNSAYTQKVPVPLSLKSIFSRSGREKRESAHTKRRT